MDSLFLNTSKRLNNVAFYSRTYTLQREKYIHHQKIKLLDWEISDVHLHINFLKNQLNRIHSKLENTSVPRTILSRFYELDELKFKRIFRSENAKLIKKINKLAQQFDIPLVPVSEIDNYFQNLTEITIPQEVAEVVALGSQFCSVPKPNKQNIIDTVKNVEFALKKADLPYNTQQTIRHKIVNHIWAFRHRNPHLDNFQKSVAKKSALA